METITSCKQGQLKGVIENDTLAFYNIPYGKMEKRFHPLVQPDRWDGIRDATKPGPIFPQVANRLASVMGVLKEEANQSEDAFSVNIWTRQLNEKRPVIIWIHGGGFKTGGGSLPWYNGSSLTKNGDVVTVTLNYRLGPLGHLYLPEQIECNLGLSDLIQAFKWIVNNISHFGGDPNNITLAGQSAGASYVFYLSLQSEITTYIKNICLFSLPNLSPLTKNDAQKLSNTFLSISNVKDLNELSIDKVLKYQEEAEKQVTKELGRNVVFSPVQDGKYIDEHFLEVFVKNVNGKINVLLGATEEESAAFYHFLSHRPDYKQFIQEKSYEMFLKMIEQLVNRLSETNSNIFYYRFKHRSPNESFLSCHCFELPFLFNNFEMWKDCPMLDGIDEVESTEIAKDFQSKILNFVKYSNPNDKRSNGWKKYTPNSQFTFQFK